MTITPNSHSIAILSEPDEIAGPSLSAKTTQRAAGVIARSCGVKTLHRITIALAVLLFCCGSALLGQTDTTNLLTAFPATQAASPSPIKSSLFGLTSLSIHGDTLIKSGAVRNLDVSSPFINWASINTAPGVYDWTALDAWVALAQSRNQDIIFLLGGTPTWASPKPWDTSAFNNPGSNWPPSIDIWSAWVNAVSTRYKGKIKYYEMWNEPDNSGNWPVDDPNSFAELTQYAQVAHDIVHAADPGALMMTPSYTALMWAPMLGQLLSYGTSPYDVIAFHSYLIDNTYTSAENIGAVIQAYKAQANQYGLGNLPMVSTEGSWGTGGQYITNPQQQADFLVKYYVIHAVNGVTTATWYAAEAGQNWGGLQNGNQLKPAGVAYNNVYNWLVGSTITSSSTDNSGTYVVNLNRPDGTPAAIVWNSQRVVLYQNGAMNRGHNVQGDAWDLNSGGSVYVGSSPVYVTPN